MNAEQNEIDLAYRYIEALANINLLGEINDEGNVRFAVRRFANSYDMAFVVAMITPNDPAYLLLDVHLWPDRWEVAQAVGDEEVNNLIFEASMGTKGLMAYRDAGSVWARMSVFISTGDDLPDVGHLAAIIQRSLLAMEYGCEQLVEALRDAAGRSEAA